MRPAVGPVRDRALHFRHAPRRLFRSSLAAAHQAVALSPFIVNPRRNASSLGSALADARAFPLLALLASCRARRKPRPPWIRFARFSRLRPASSLSPHGFIPCVFLPIAATGFSPYYQAFLINSNTLTRHLDRHSAKRDGGSKTQTLKNSNTL